MGVLLGGITSLLYGVGDFVGGEATRRAPAAANVFGAGLLALPLISIAALALGGEARGADWVFGGLAGVSGAIGLVFLFAGLARGKVAAVAPAAAACGAALPVVVGVALGERPSPLAWTGVVVALPAIVLSSWVADRAGVPGGGLGYGVAAGSLFGTYTVVISRTAEASNLLPLIPARTATVVTMLALAAGGAWHLRSLGTIHRGLVAGHGVLDVTGNVTLLLALRSGSLALVSIAASMYPAVTVALARVINHEHLRKRQVVGVLLTLLALTLIAAG